MTSTHRYPPEVAPDHLVVAAASLEQGVDWIEDKLGTRPQPGGRHVAMGTHNALLRLGARLYLELSRSTRRAARRNGRAGSISTSRGCGPHWPKVRR